MKPTLPNQMAARRSRQQTFVWKTVGGARPGAGRKRAAANVGLQPHVARPELVARVPVHVTMRAARGVPAMRTQLVAQVVLAEMTRASAKGFRVLHFSVQNDHIHLIAEGDDAASFSRGMQRLASRVARGVNLLAGRRGSFWRERYHRRDLGSPRQFRNALVYVTNNFRKHADARDRAERTRAIDGFSFSSAMWLDDWADDALVARLREMRSGLSPPVVRAATWIARVGWKRLGKLRPTETPRLPG